MGQFPRLIRQGHGEVLRLWANEVPNEGIIRYLDFFNMERLAIVSPAALAEVLVYKNYDFEKPANLRKGISRILGMGLFLAEGDEHKVTLLSLVGNISQLSPDAEPKKEPHARFQLPAYQEFISDLLGQVQIAYTIIA